jgi:hypothetical protein
MVIEKNQHGYFAGSLYEVTRIDKLFISDDNCGTIGLHLCPNRHNKQRYKSR